MCSCLIRHTDLEILPEQIRKRRCFRIGYRCAHAFAPCRRYESRHVPQPAHALCRSDERRLQHTEGEEENGPDDEVRANAGHESASFCFDGCGDDHRMADHVQRSFFIYP